MCVHSCSKSQSPFDEVIQQCWLLSFFQVKDFYWLSFVGGDCIYSSSWIISQMPFAATGVGENRWAVTCTPIISNLIQDHNNHS